MENSEPKIKVYIAAPFFREGERERIEALRKFFEEDDFYSEYEFFYPMDHVIDDGAVMSNEEWAKAVFDMDLKALEHSDLVIAIYDKQYSDSGTAWEIGYAAALGTPIILLCTDLNAENSIMPICSASKVYDYQKFVDGEFWDFDDFDFETLM